MVARVTNEGRAGCCNFHAIIARSGLLDHDYTREFGQLTLHCANRRFGSAVFCPKGFILWNIVLPHGPMRFEPPPVCTQAGLARVTIKLPRGAGARCPRHVLILIHIMDARWRAPQLAHPDIITEIRMRGRCHPEEISNELVPRRASKSWVRNARAISVNKA